MISEAARVQQRLWGTDPDAWATHAEAHNRPLFDAVLDAAAVGPGARVLDVGCGSGLALVLAAQRGAIPSGVDISAGLLSRPGSTPRRRPVPRRHGGVAFDDASFDAVLGINAFQSAGDPRLALREAARVLAPDGRIVASLFAAPERSQGTVVHEAMSQLVTAEQHDDHAPYALSAPGGLEAALVDAGLRLADEGEVMCAWRYASMDDALTGILCSAGGARAREAAGEAAARATVHDALKQFEDADTGVVEMLNTFRWVAACR